MIDTIRIIPFDGVPNMDIWRKDQEREDHDLYRFGDSWRWFVSKSRRNSSLEGTGPALFGRPNWQRLSPSEITQIPDKFRFLGVGGYSVVRVDYCSDYEVDSSSYLLQTFRTILLLSSIIIFASRMAFNLFVKSFHRSKESAQTSAQVDLPLPVDLKPSDGLVDLPEGSECFGDVWRTPEGLYWRSGRLYKTLVAASVPEIKRDAFGQPVRD